MDYKPQTLNPKYTPQVTDLLRSNSLNDQNCAQARFPLASVHGVVPLDGRVRICEPFSRVCPKQTLLPQLYTAPVPILSPAESNGQVLPTDGCC
jgi:hypothetical protein